MRARSISPARGRRFAIPVRGTLPLVAALAPPEIALLRSRRRVALAITVRNEGWVDARDVCVRIALPAGLKPDDGSLTLDGMPVAAGAARGAAQTIARAVRVRDVRSLVIALVPARASVRVALAATFRPHCAEGTIRIAADDLEAIVPFAPHYARELRVRLAAAPRCAAPGEAVAITARVENIGDLAEEVTLALAGTEQRERAPDATRTLPAGGSALITVPLTISPALHDGDVHSGELVAHDANGERARLAFCLPIREQPEPDCEGDADRLHGDTICGSGADEANSAAFAVRFVLEPVTPFTAVAEEDNEPAPAAPAHGSEPARKAIAFSMRLDGARLDEIGRLLPGLRAGGLVGHLFALRLFFPDGGAANDAALAPVLAAAGDALRDVFDRLFVKLRIPGYDVSADDLEDAALRAALAVLLDRLANADDRRAPADVVAAPFGAPAVLRALLALLPVRCDDDPRFAAALADHAAQLENAIARYEGMPLEVFDEALAHRSEPALDRARANLLDALQPHLGAAEVPC